MDPLDFWKQAAERVKPIAPTAEITADCYINQKGVPLYRLRMLAMTHKDAINRFDKDAKVCLDKFEQAMRRHFDKPLNKSQP